MTEHYCLESDCYAFSGRCSATTGQVRAYLRLTTEEALQAILGLFKQGLAPAPVLEYLGEDKVIQHFLRETW